MKMKISRFTGTLLLAVALPLALLVFCSAVIINRSSVSGDVTFSADSARAAASESASGSVAPQEMTQAEIDALIRQLAYPDKNWLLNAGNNQYYCVFFGGESANAMSAGMFASDYGSTGNIVAATKNSDTSYTCTFYVPGGISNEAEVKETTYIISLDLSKLKNGKITITGLGGYDGEYTLMNPNYYYQV